MTMDTEIRTTSEVEPPRLIDRVRTIVVRRPEDRVEHEGEIRYPR